MPPLVEARDVIAAFQAMVRKRSLPISILARHRQLEPDRIFRRRRHQGLGSRPAAITEPWSNGQTEGQITKLKLVKRQMYGRGKIDLLQARLIGAM